VAEAARCFFLDPDTYDEKGAAKHFAATGATARLGAALEAFAAVPAFTAEALEGALDAHPAVAEAGGRAAFIHAVRLAVSGGTVGPGLFEMLALLGPERVERRLRRAISLIASGRFAPSVVDGA
jgi:glutamyl-tRNA synthetase